MSNATGSPWLLSHCTMWIRAQVAIGCNDREVFVHNPVRILLSGLKISVFLWWSYISPEYPRSNDVTEPTTTTELETAAGLKDSGREPEQGIGDSDGWWRSPVQSWESQRWWCSYIVDTFPCERITPCVRQLSTPTYILHQHSREYNEAITFISIAKTNPLRWSWVERLLLQLFSGNLEAGTWTTTLRTEVRRDYIWTQIHNSTGYRLEEFHCQPQKGSWCGRVDVSVIWWRMVWSGLAGPVSWWVRWYRSDVVVRELINPSCVCHRRPCRPSHFCFTSQAAINLSRRPDFQPCFQKMVAITFSLIANLAIYTFHKSRSTRKAVSPVLLHPNWGYCQPVDMFLVPMRAKWSSVLGIL